MPFTHESASQPRVTSDSRLQQIRIAQGLKQSEMAAVLDVSSTQWQRWEKGKAPVPKMVWLALKGLYDIDISDELHKYASCTIVE